MTTTALLVRRFLADYTRNGPNLVLLAVIPVVFVVVAAPPMADAARLLGGTGGGPAVETVTAGWAAAFLSAVAMYFQISTARTTDRRLALAGLARLRLATARLTAGAVLALMATLVAVLALTARGPVDDPWRVATGTVMFAVVYLGLGAVVGALVPNAVNGTVILMFIWILDAFFGPTLSGSESAVLRLLPTHFISLWTVALPSGHGGPEELAVSLGWVITALALALWVIASTTTTGRTRRASRTGRVGQLLTSLRMGWHDWRRTPVLWLLLAIVPAVFILLSDAVTPHGHTPVVLREAGAKITSMVDPVEMHGGTMAPVAIASLAALVGVFVVLDARAADRRLALAGQRPSVLLATRLTMVLTAAAIATAVSLAVTATVFDARNWGVYIGGVALLAVTYALIGVVLGPVFGRVSGTFMAFLIPFLDLGIGQSPMLRGEPASWAHWLPGYGGTRVMIDGALTSGFDEAASLTLGLGWIAVLLLTATVLLRSIAGTPLPKPSRRAHPAHA
ncbi:ABC transporter permease [Nocardioides allogilvus]|uniref:ABC transporter permease n=1 Tax=Nocardioides allogilvus TaxID=2072017 RepID=UPI000D2F6274|nr:ABC transporter permease [Nocardioides allogilvus]